MNFVSLQQSCAFHYVLTLEHAVAEGHHYYQASTLQATSFQIVHSFVHQFSITNQTHDSAPSMLRRILTATIDHYLSSNPPDGMICLLCQPVFHMKVVFAGFPSPHVIDVTTVEGLFDIIALGNVLEFSAALDARTYAH